jgi:hypothetical protein
MGRISAIGLMISSISSRSSCGLGRCFVSFGFSGGAGALGFSALIGSFDFGISLAPGAGGPSPGVGIGGNTFDLGSSAGGFTSSLGGTAGFGLVPG